jgi:TPR repeat protein
MMISITLSNKVTIMNASLNGYIPREAITTCVALFTVLLTHATPAAAQGTSAAFTAGNEAYARQDYKTAAVRFAEACDNGSATACGKLGEMYVKGQGLTASGARAAAPLAKACDGDVASACGALSAIYEQGNGVSQNKNLAVALYEKAKKIDPKLAVAYDDFAVAQRSNLTEYPTQNMWHDPKYKKQPPTPNQIRLLTDAINKDSQSWYSNRYVAESLTNIYTVIYPEYGATFIHGNYLFNKGEKGSLYIRVQDGETCIQYYDVGHCSAIRTAIRAADYASSSKATPAQAAMLTTAINQDSQSWLTRRYDAGTLNNVKVVGRDDKITIIQGHFRYDKGINQAWIAAKIEGGRVQCIDYITYDGGPFEHASCKPVRTQSAQGAANAYRNALQERKGNWNRCVSSYVYKEYHECGSEPGPGFDLDF